MKNIICDRIKRYFGKMLSVHKGVSLSTKIIQITKTFPISKKGWTFIVHPVLFYSLFSFFDASKSLISVRSLMSSGITTGAGSAGVSTTGSSA